MLLPPGRPPGSTQSACVGESLHHYSLSSHFTAPSRSSPWATQRGGAEISGPRLADWPLAAAGLRAGSDRPVGYVESVPQ